MLNPIYFRVKKIHHVPLKAGAGPPALAGTSRPPREQRSFKATAAGKSLGWEAQRRRDGWLRYVGRKKETCDLQ
jgi:hypothetical protein